MKYLKSKNLLFFCLIILSACSDSIKDRPKAFLNNDREQKKNYIPEFDFVGTELTSIDRGSIPGDRLQAVTFYDGKDTADLYIELASRGEKKWLKLPESQNFGKKVNSFEYKLFGYEPTGCFKVDKVKANGVIDGMAFGVLFKGDNGYKLFKSKSVYEKGLEYVGMWPYDFSSHIFEELRDGEDFNATRNQIKTLIYGSEVLKNGVYCMDGY